MEKIAACSHSRYSLKHKHTHIRVYLWMWLFVFCWQSLLTLCLTLVIFCHVSELKFLTQWIELSQHHLEMRGPSSGWPIQKVKDVSLLHMCIAVLKHAEEKMVWSEQRENTAGWTCMKQGENCSSLRGWFRVPLSCSCLRMKVIKLIWSNSLGHEDWMKQFFPLFSYQAEPERPVGEAWLDWGFPAGAISSDGL